MCRAFHESQAEAELKIKRLLHIFFCTVRNDGNAKGNRFLRLDFNNAAHKVSTPDALLVIFKEDGPFLRQELYKDRIACLIHSLPERKRGARRHVICAWIALDRSGHCDILLFITLGIHKDAGRLPRLIDVVIIDAALPLFYRSFIKDAVVIRIFRTVGKDKLPIFFS